MDPLRNFLDVCKQLLAQDWEVKITHIFKDQNTAKYRYDGCIYNSKVVYHVHANLLDYLSYMFITIKLNVNYNNVY